jgi:hypothetical protein
MIVIMLRRETIIALRARHTAFRIAVEILYPPQPPPPPVQPAIPILEDDDSARAEWEALERHRALEAKRRARQYRRLMPILLTLLVAFWLWLIIYGIFFYEPASPPPPPPQAQPIPPASPQ